jgi:hypothetical protein
MGLFTAELNTPETNGFTIVSLVSVDDSKLIVVEETLDTCPVKTPSPVTPALTTAYLGLDSDAAAIVLEIDPETPATFGAEQSKEGKRKEKVKILIKSRNLFMVVHFIGLGLNIT